MVWVDNRRHSLYLHCSATSHCYWANSPSWLLHVLLSMLSSGTANLSLSNWYALSCLVENEMKLDTNGFLCQWSSNVAVNLDSYFHICLCYSGEQKQEVGCGFGSDLNSGAQRASQENYLSFLCSSFVVADVSLWRICCTRKEWEKSSDTHG